MLKTNDLIRQCTVQKSLPHLESLICTSVKIPGLSVSLFLKTVVPFCNGGDPSSIDSWSISHILELTQCSKKKKWI